jgi:transketolase
MRRSFVKTLLDVSTDDNRVWLLTGDLGYGILEPFRDRFPDRFINAGVGEANMVGVATGLALKGKIVFVYSITPFIVFKCFEQVRMLAHMNQHVVLVGVGIGREYANQGISHYADGDEEVMRTLPLKILTPLSKEDVKEKVIDAYHHKGTSYLRLSRY